ncbi:MAG: hypothetical protein AAF658_13910, partial [Myxococcota bacterium]
TAWLASNDSGLNLNTTDARFAGAFLVGGNVTDCVAVDGAPVESGTCSTDGSPGSSVEDAVLWPAQDVSSTFGGFIGGPIAHDAIDDWFLLEPFQNYAADVPFPGQNGNCDGTGVPCRRFDYRLRSADGVLRNRALFDGDVQTLPEPSLDACPSALRVRYADLQTATNQFFGLADEILFDERGDEDGLCESGESCWLSPNIGAFQGPSPETPEFYCELPESTLLYRRGE